MGLFLHDNLCLQFSEPYLWVKYGVWVLCSDAAFPIAAHEFNLILLETMTDSSKKPGIQSL